MINSYPLKYRWDSSKNDGDDIKSCYPVARYLEKEFGIDVLPTFLFLNADGTILHRGKGAFSGKDFVNLVNDAANPDEQVYTQIRKAAAGKLSNLEMSELAKKLDEAEEKELASKVARSYFEQYLFKLDHDKFFTKENLEFFGKYKTAVKSTDKVFDFIRKNPEKVDSFIGILGKGFSVSLIEAVIYTEEIRPGLLKAEKAGELPHWEEIHTNIARNYGEDYAKRTIINTKVVWFRQRDMWKDFLENLILQIEMMGDLSKIHWLMLNGSAWYVFQHSDNKEQLEIALHWSEIAVQAHLKDSTVTDAPWGGILDTYANILYKLGRKDEAIKFYQEKILAGKLQTVSLYETYVKMFKDIPTWE